VQNLIFSKPVQYFLAVVGISILTAGMHVLQNQINPITVALIFCFSFFLSPRVAAVNPRFSRRLQRCIDTEITEIPNLRDVQSSP